jgi:hypothetical protein
MAKNRSLFFFNVDIFIKMQEKKRSRRLRAIILLILVISSITPTGFANTATDHGLEWGIDTGQVTSHRLVESLANQTHGTMIMEDVLIFLKADTIPEMPENITAFSDVPLAWGSMLTQQGEDFIPYLSKLDIYPPLFVNHSKQRIAVPIGNWSLMTQLCLEFPLYRQSENNTHWSTYIGTVTMIAPSLFGMAENIPITPITPLPGFIYIKQNWTYHKSNGILAGAEGSWETSEILLEYRMIEAEFSTYSSTTEADPSTSSEGFDQELYLEGLFVILGTTCGVSLVLVAYVWRIRFK